MLEGWATATTEGAVVGPLSPEFLGVSGTHHLVSEGFRGFRVQSLGFRAMRLDLNPYPHSGKIPRTSLPEAPKPLKRPQALKP